MENENDDEELNTLVERLDSAIEEAGLLLDSATGTLTDDADAREARDITQELRNLMDDIADESRALHQSHEAFLENQEREQQANNTPTPEPTPSPSPSATTNSGGQEDNPGTSSPTPSNGNGN